MSSLRGCAHPQLSPADLPPRAPTPPAAPFAMERAPTAPLDLPALERAAAAAAQGAAADKGKPGAAIQAAPAAASIGGAAAKARRRAGGVRVDRLLEYPVRTLVFEAGDSLAEVGASLAGPGRMRRAWGWAAACAGQGKWLENRTGVAGSRGTERQAHGSLSGRFGRRRGALALTPPVHLTRATRLPPTHPQLAELVGTACQRLTSANVPHNLFIADCGARVFLFPNCFAEKKALGLIPEGEPGGGGGGWLAGDHSWRFALAVLVEHASSGQARPAPGMLLPGSSAVHRARAASGPLAWLTAAAKARLSSCVVLSARGPRLEAFPACCPPPN